MPTIRQLPSGMWNVQVRVTGHKPRSASFPTKQEARVWSVEQLNQIAELRPFKTFYELGDRFCRKGLQGKKTQQEAFGQLARICRDFDHLGIPTDLDKITKQHINAYKMHRLSHVANATCRKDLSLISRIYKWANREHLMELTSPVEGVSIPPIGKPRTRIVSGDELEQLMAALSPEMAAIVELAYETAMRRTEIVRLTLQDLHLEERYLNVVDGKTGDRPVPLTRRAIELLGESSRACLTPESRLFPITPHSVSTAVRRARKRAGLSDDIILHQLRHTRITEVAKRGFNQAQIMMVSGHRDVRSVQRYTHLSVHDVVDLLD